MAAKKPKTISKLKKDLWKLFSLYIKLARSEDGQYVACYTCDKPLEIGTSNCQGGHLFSKAAYPIYYFDERAVRPQCYYCNINLGGDELNFFNRLKEEIGEDVAQEMYDNRHEKVKRSREWYIGKLGEYKVKLAEIQSN